MPRWLSENAEPLILAFILSLVVWLAGVNSSDPIEEGLFPDAVAIEYLGPSDGFVTTGNLPTEATVSLRAPASVWTGLTADDLHVQVDLQGLGAGTHSVVVRASVKISSARVRSVDPASINVTIEQQATRAVPVRIEVTGEPATRYRLGDATTSTQQVTVSGPASNVGEVVEAVARVPLAGQDSIVLRTVELVPRNAAGIDVRGVTLTPSQVSVEVPIALPGGYRSVAVIPLVTGQVLPGYYVTNMSVSPPTVTVFASSPSAVEALPGFVQTEAISLDGASQSIERRVSLALPGGFSLVDEQSVLVQVTIAPIQSSLTISREVEVVGLESGLFARPSVEHISVILTGSLPVLEQLRPEDVRIILDLQGLQPGVHQVAPESIVLPSAVRVQTIIPDLIEVTISRTPFGTPTPIP
ncbi:MAG TPA: CdaR family protein [Anaerolineales bacterium]|nr:CdaR family protein [Anaerolineales bacterium]